MYVMKLDVYAHCSIDHISTGGKTSILAGGSACYCGIMAANLGSNVHLVSRYGDDFAPYTKYLDHKKINYSGCLCDTPSTSFDICEVDSSRVLRLKNLCEPLQYVKSDSDGVLASPIFCEIDSNLYKQLQEHSGFLFLDPQGFIRFEKDNLVSVQRTSLDFTSIDAIKVDSSELQCLTGASDEHSIQVLQKNGIQYVLHTVENLVTMYVKDRAYSLKIPHGTPSDTVGLGDILSAAFCSTMIKENDPLWAFCFACGAVQAARDSGKTGLEKIPNRGQTVTNASYFYNTVDFRQV